MPNFRNLRMVVTLGGTAAKGLTWNTIEMGMITIRGYSVTLRSLADDASPKFGELPIKKNTTNSIARRGTLWKGCMYEGSEIAFVNCEETNATSKRLNLCKSSVPSKQN
ncbi:uncharacterized protein LOC119642372 [Glossina fuscipes]|uniref:Uncharacterized protein LOC119642372 n=1 Tax=Glossina fuscipes TaxID=7396 RepID=A0A9C5ZIX5_9MUSC|nr:uncharacterized protein LOC119642372 [Glossina fuscipes]